MNKKIILISAIFLVVVALAVATRFLDEEKEVNVPNIKKEELALDTVKAYFTNSKLDPEVTCQKVFPVERKIIAMSKNPDDGRELFYDAAVI